MSELDFCRKEMNVYCRYLLNVNTDEQSLVLFERAIDNEHVLLSDNDKKLLQFILNNTWSLSCIDAAIGLFYPKHKLRKRMIIAFAILETNPIYFNFFKPKVYGPLHIITLFIKGGLQIIQALIGRLILVLF